MLLVRGGPLPHHREAAVFLIGAGAGLAAAPLWARSHRPISTTGPALALIVRALAFYLAFEIDELNHWPAWTLVLLTWAVVETIRPPRP